MEIVSLGTNVAWGIRKYAERGLVNDGFCYGYYNDKNRTWSINEEKANVVKQIYRTGLKGKSYGVIAEEITVIKYLVLQVKSIGILEQLKRC